MTSRIRSASAFNFLNLRLHARTSWSICLVIAAILLTGCSGMGTAMKASPTLSHSFGVVNIPVAELERRYTNEASEFVKINGYRIHYRDEGQGEPIVLVHGDFSSLHTWDHWASALKDRHRVIRLDLPGYGLTGAPKDPMAFDRASIAATFAEFIERLKLNSFSLVGHSLGAEIAAEYAAMNSNRINSLVLVAPTGFPREVDWTTQLLTTDFMAAVTNYIQAPSVLGGHINDAYGDPDRLSKEDGNRYMHMSMRPGSQRMYTKTRQFMRERAEGAEPKGFDRIQAPTLLMWGGADSVTPPGHADLWAAEVNNSAVVLYEEAGHMPMEEFPEQTLAAAQKFLNKGISAFPDYEAVSAETVTSR